MKKHYLKINLTLIITALLLMAVSWAGETETDDPVPAYTPPLEKKLTPVKLPPIKEKILDNGLKVVVVEHHELPVISMRLMCKVGSQFDPQGKAGVTQFMAGLLEKGTTSLSATQIADKIDYIGGELGTGSGWSATYVTCTVLRKHLQEGLDLMQDVVLHPAFADEEIERSRSRALSAIESSKDQPRAIASRAYDKWLFGDHPYANPTGGTMVSIEALTRDDIVTQYGQVFVPNNSVLFIVGDTKPKEGFKLAEKAFGDWETGEIPVVELPAVKEPTDYNIRIVDKPDATQTQIRFGHMGISRDNEDYFPVVLMNYIMGGGGFSSRLMKVIRSEMGLTYGIYSSFSSRHDRGPFSVYTYTKNESTALAVDETIRLIKEFIENGATEQELDEAKSYYTGSYPLNFETPSNIANQLQYIEIYDLGSDYIEKYRSRINAVTMDDVKRVANKYLHPDDMIFVLVGNADDIKSEVEHLGPVEVIEIDDVF